MGSPGAEKRGTRSPLPPLPQGDTSMYSGHSPQPPHSPPRSVAPLAERPTQRALEEMYAKVGGGLKKWQIEVCSATRLHCYCP